MSRSANFTGQEMVVLVTALENCRDLVSGQLGKNIKTPNEQKEEWNNVANLVNATGGSERSTETIKKKWHDIKYRTKAKAANINKHVNGTGGGPPIDQKLSEIEERILNLIGETSWKGIPNGLDTLELQANNRPGPSDASPNCANMNLIGSLLNSPEFNARDTLLGNEKINEHRQSWRIQDFHSTPSSSTENSKKRKYENDKENVMRTQKKINETLESILEKNTQYMENQEKNNNEVKEYLAKILESQNELIIAMNTQTKVLAHIANVSWCE